MTWQSVHGESIDESIKDVNESSIEETCQPISESKSFNDKPFNDIVINE